MTKELFYNAFTLNSVGSVFGGMWSQPRSRQTEYCDLDYWVELARLLEAGGMDALFFADVIGAHDTYGGNSDVAVKLGVEIPINDPVVLVSAMAHATQHLGFAFTSSVIQEHPFQFARRVSTLDHLTKGRIGWNIVTSASRSAARNFGMDRLPPHDARYRWAEEYMDVVYRLWEDSWEDGAVIADKRSGVYADPRKVHAIEFAGERYQVAGPHLAEPSPQRTPVLFQAGASSAGRAFAARHAEVVFIQAGDPSGAEAHINDVRARAVATGRAPDDVRFSQAITFVLGSTEREARRLASEYDEWRSDEADAALMSSFVAADLKGIDRDLPVGELGEVEGIQGVVKALAEGASDRSQTFGELLKTFTVTRVVGTPEQAADQVERWAEAGVDGFNVQGVISPGTWEDFIQHVCPVLRKRGLMRHEYASRTLRERLFPGRGARLGTSHPARQERPATIVTMR
jgi:long-chain alkane monooxygenase